MQCPKCQKESPDAKQCSHCGYVAEVQPDDQPQPLLAAPAPEAALAGTDKAVPPVVEPPEIPPSAEAPPAAEEKNLQAEPLPKNEEEKASQQEKKVGKIFKSSELRQYNEVMGDVGILIESLKVFGERPTEPKGSLFELTKSLPAFASEISASVLGHLTSQINRLREERLLLLSCLDEKLALTAAYTLIQELGEEGRLLNFEWIAEEGRDLTIYQLLKEREEGDRQMVILVDALSQRALPFLESLLSATSSGYGSIKEELKSNGLLLICLADPTEVEKRVRATDLLLAQWQIPFLRPLLQTYYPDQCDALETQILRQREMGKWHRDERSFYEQIRTPLHSQRLPTVVTSLEEGADMVSAESPIKDGTTVEDTVLYVATYFPNLSPKEFIRVVSLLLGERTTTITGTAQEKAEDGTYKTVQTQQEKELRELWQKAPDEKMKACRLMTSKDLPKVVAFADHRLKEAVREQLEEEHSFFLENRFSDVQQFGLLFDKSEKIAGNVIRLYVEMLAADPGSYGIGWLVEMVQSLNGESGARSQRVADLLCGMLERRELVEMVEHFLNHLMMTRQHRVVLELVKGLRLASGFKDLDWIKRLLNEADEATRLHTYTYLYAEARRLDLGVYDLLQALEPWLPKDDTDPHTYSLSERHTLQLVIEYCLETTSRFEAKHYGLWPIRHPLLALQDEATARHHLALLMRWLFHPGLKKVFQDRDSNENINRMLGALLAEWFFVIKGQPEEANEKARSETRPNLADKLLQILLEEIITQTGMPQRKDVQRELVVYWEQFKEFLLLISQAIGHDDRKLRQELTWKRNLIGNTLRQFRELQKTCKIVPRLNSTELSGRD